METTIKHTASDSALSSEWQYDVIIAGSGAGGLATAVTAAHHGLKVLLAERAPFCGGATARSGGWAWTPGNPLAVADGVIEPPDDYRAYKLQAKVYEALNKPALAHRALAQVYELHDLLRPAIEQMRLAQRSRGASDHEEAAIDAHLRELRARMCDEMGGKPVRENREGGRDGNRRDPDRCDKLIP